MKKQSLVLLSFILFILFTLTGCGSMTRNTGPELLEAEPVTPIDIAQNETIQLTITARDPDGDPLVYKWAKTDGTFNEPTDQASIYWTAPSIDGVQTVTVIITDGTDSIEYKWIIDVGNTVTGVIEVDNHIFQNTTWRSGNTYVIKKSIDVDEALVIEPGTIVKFMPDTMLTVNGNIHANGTASEPIIFTSYTDDLGGDTNGDNKQTIPQSQEWKYIALEGVEGASFTYCEFYYGGQGDQFGDGTLFLNRSFVTINNCTFAHNGNGINAKNTFENTSITNNTFFDNQIPLIINPTFNVDDSNQFHNPDNPDQTNQYNQILIYTSNIQQQILWEETEVPFVISGNLEVLSSGTLILSNQLVLKFKRGSSLGHNDNLNVGDDLIFTSYRDDSYGDDTNGDGDATKPAPEDWVGILNRTNGAYETWTNILYDTYALHIAQY